MRAHVVAVDVAVVFLESRAAGDPPAGCKCSPSSGNRWVGGGGVPFLGIPRLPLMVLVGALVGASRGTLILLIATLTWPVVARLLRSEALSLRQRGFVSAARGFGGGTGYIVRRHLLPAVAPIAIGSFILIAGNAILLEAALAFLGLSDPIGVSWGLMLNRALLHPGLYFIDAWMWWVLPAGFAITLAVMGFAFLGVGLEPVLNPRWRRRL